jgi:hypothetical protein
VIRFLYPPHDCRVTGVSVAAGSGDFDATELRLQPLVSPGTELRMPPRGYVARWGYAMAIGSQVEACEKAIESNLDRLHLDAAPL